MSAEITQKIWGRAQGMVEDAKTGEIVYTSPWTDNLVLNNGLNFCLNNGHTGTSNYSPFMFGSWPNGDINQSFLEVYFAYGTGTSPNSYASTICATPVSASQTGNIITLTDLFSPLQVFDVLKYDDGTSTFITSASPNGLEFVSRKSLVKSDQHFTVWNTSRHTLDGFVEASNTKYQNQATTRTINAAVGVVSAAMYRQFSIVSGATQNVTEVGACTGEGNTTAMATRLTFGAPIPVADGQRFILTYQYFCEIPLLSASNAGYSATSGVNANITGWPSASGQFGFYLINNQGNGGGLDDFLPRPGGAAYTNPYIIIYQDRRPFNTIYSTVATPTGEIGGSLSEITIPTYVDNSFERSFTKVYDPTDVTSFNSSDIGSIIWISRDPYNPANAIRFNFETPQTKTATQRLTLTLTTKVSRDL